MSLSIERLSKIITPDTSGIIWITDSPLTTQLNGVNEFNYLTNGLLVKSIQEQKESNRSNHFFITDSFGSPFFVSHLSKNKDLKPKDLYQKVYNQVEIAKPILSKDDCIIYVYNKSTSTDGLDLLKELSKRYNNIKFNELSL